MDIGENVLTVKIKDCQLVDRSVNRNYFIQVKLIQSNEQKQQSNYDFEVDLSKYIDV